MSGFKPFLPGELIIAARINDVLSMLDQRVTSLEAASSTGSGRMSITGLSPEGPLHMGDIVTVLGNNFGLPSQVIVTINEARLSASAFLPGSGNTALVFQIPVVQGVPPGGLPVTLTANNPTSGASYQFTLFPFAMTIPTGEIFANMSGPPAVGSVTANNSYVYMFTVSVSTSLTDVFALSASLDSAAAAAGWKAIAIDNAVSRTQVKQVTVKTGNNVPLQVPVLVTVPATPVVASATLSLTVTSSLNPVGLAGSGSTTIDLNAAPALPNLIAITIVAVNATGVPGGTFTGTTGITLPRGAVNGIVAVQALCPNVDNYACVGPKFDAAGWAGSVPPSKQTFPTTQANQTVLIQFNLTSLPAGPASTTMHFQVTSSDAGVQGQISPTISIL